jgi:glycosyltransferase involved in cell wall biosynthesis
VKYVLAHNPEVPDAKVEIAPNSCDVPEEVTALDASAAGKVREKLGLPVGRPIFIYGGNMGRPQGIPFLVECLRAVAFREDCYFVVVGDGAEYPKLEAFMNEVKPTAVSLFKRLPKEDYDQLAAACDVGLIFLDWRFTIPNYPSRLLSYLPERKPIIAVTDVNCDTGTLAEENGYGFFCPSNSVEAFVGAVDRMLASDRGQMGENGYRYFLENYTTQNTYEAIVRHLR